MSDKLKKIEPTGAKLANLIASKQIQVATIEMNLNIAKTLSKPIIRNVFKNADGDAFTLITILVKRFVDSFGFSTKMSESQIEMLSVDTFEKFSYESIEDVILFFKMCRSGSFGATNRGVDSNLIYGDWFPKYMEFKSIEREKMIEENKNKSNIDARGVSLEAIYKNKLKKLKSNTKKDFETQVKEHVNHICKNFDRQMLEDTITDWIKDENKKDWVHLLKLKRKEIK